MISPWHYLDTLPKGVPIAWDRLVGLCRVGMGKLLMQAGSMVGSQPCVAAGRRAQFCGNIQRRYGVAADEARRLLIASEQQADDPWYTGGSSRYAALPPNLPASTGPANASTPQKQLETR